MTKYGEKHAGFGGGWYFFTDHGSCDGWDYVSAEKLPSIDHANAYQKKLKDQKQLILLEDEKTKLIRNRKKNTYEIFWLNDRCWEHVCELRREPSKDSAVLRLMLNAAGRIKGLTTKLNKAQKRKVFRHEETNY
jgi:hypothetical protein